MTAATPVRTVPTERSAPVDRRWAMLAVLLGGQFMALLDATIVNVAMPTIAVDLPASGASLQLVVSGFIISYAVLLITGARLGDLFGPRRLFLLGVGGFTLASLACGLAPNIATLIGARFVQGAGAAMMVPQVMSLIQARFSGPDRAKALSAYAAVIATGGIAGQLVGGLLVAANLAGAGWRPIFLVNVPIGLLVLALVPKVLPAAPARGSRRLDLAGLALVTPAVVLVVVPLVLGHEEGWPGWTFAAIAVGMVLFGAFVAVERRLGARGGDPLLDVTVLRAPGIRSGLATLAAGMMAYGGFLFTFALHLQQGLGESALHAGLLFAAAGIPFGVLGLTWRRLPTRWHRWLTPVGYVIATAGYVGVALDLHSGTRGGWGLVAILFGTGLGMGLAFSPMLTVALVRVPVERAADASGLLTTTLQLSQVIGVAVFGTVYLSAVHRPGAVPSAHALTATYLGVAAVMTAGIGFAAGLARAARPTA